MANSRTANTIYIDTAANQVVELTNVKVSGILFTGGSPNDAMILKEMSSGPIKLKIQAASADDTKYFDFSQNNLVFSQGIYVDTLSSGAVATLIIG